MAALAQAASSPALIGPAFLGFALVFAWFKAREAAHDADYSVTGVVAALVVFVLGALCVLGDPQLAAAGGVATAGVLAARERLHAWLARLTWPELRSALLLAAMTVIVLPLLPDRAVDPFGGVNPRDIWLFTVLTAAISSVGYVAVKLAGPSRGVLFGAVAGALVSSTAVTVAFARRAAAGEPTALLAGGAAAAGTVSILRVTAILAVAGPRVLPHFALPALAGAAVLGLAGAALLRRGAPGDAPSELRSPFELGPLLLFATSFAAVAAFGGWLTRRVGDAGVLATSGVFGLLDVDVATLTAARLAAGAAITEATAAQAVLLALGVNAAARVVYAAGAGPLGYWLRLLLATAVALAVGGALAAAQGLLPRLR